MVPIINLDDKTEEIDKPWAPIEVARINDQVVRMALLEGEFHWHKHAGEDELFYVYKGSITIQLKDQPDISLQEGEVAARTSSSEIVNGCHSGGMTYKSTATRYKLPANGLSSAGV